MPSLDDISLFRVLYRRPNERPSRCRDSRPTRANFPTYIFSQRTKPDGRHSGVAIRARYPRAPRDDRRASKWRKRIYVYPVACVEDGEHGGKRERDDERDILARALRNGPVLMDSRTWYEVLPDFAWPAKIFLIHKLHQPFLQDVSAFSRASFIELFHDKAKRKKSYQIITIAISLSNI